MAKKIDLKSLGILLIILILGLILYIVEWTIANWIPALFILIIIGIIYLIYRWQKDIQSQKDQQRQKFDRIEREKKEIQDRIEREKLLKEFEERRKEKEIQDRIEREKLLKEFEERQTKLGLFKYTDRYGKTKWGTLQELEIWNQEENLLINRIVNAIEKFKPTRNWEYEDGYHKELLGYLGHDFPDIKYEFQKGSSRPDLVIQNIAIEIKGPTDNAALDTLTTKCLKYSKYYDHLIMVLFEPKFSERHFKEIQEGIIQYFPHVIIVRK